MEEKASVILSRDLLAGIDQMAGPQRITLRIYSARASPLFAGAGAASTHARDLERINHAAEE
jgi:hypothetical protein